MTLPPLWPFVLAGLVAVVVLVVMLVATLVRAYRAPLTAVDRELSAVDDDLTRREHWALELARERRLQAAARDARRAAADERRARAALTSSDGRLDNIAITSRRGGAA